MRKPRTKKRTTTPWVQINTVGEGYFNPPAVTTADVAVREVARTIPAVYKAEQVYKNGIANLPLYTYTGATQGRMTGRRKATDRPEYRLLLTAPNGRMTRTTFLKCLVADYWYDGECFFVARYDGTGAIVDLQYIPARDVVAVEVNDVGMKRFKVWEVVSSEHRIYPTVNERVVHVVREPDKYGVRGVGLLDYAREALGLHRQILNTGTAFYQNAVRPSGILELDGKPNTEAVENIRKNFKDVYAGAAKTGDIPAISGGKFNREPAISDEDIKILEALASSSSTVAQLFNLVPSDLGDQSASKYNSVAADRQDLITRAIRPVLDTFENAVNTTLFPDGECWAEFDTDEVLRGDPEQFARVVNMGITGGYFLRSEVRDWMGLEPIDGLDQPLFPLNMGPEQATDTDNGGPQTDEAAPVEDKADAPAPELDAAPVAEEQPVAATALNGAQISSLLDILAQVTAKALPVESALAVIGAAFPSVPADVVDSIIGPLKTFTPPAPAPEANAQAAF